MSYTKQEWEPASQEAAKIPEDKLRGRLIETMIISERRQRLNCLRQNQIAELREKLAAAEAENQRHASDLDVIRTSIKEYELYAQQLFEARRERDRLAAILEDAQPYVPSADFKLRAIIREALAQPEVKP